ncbi:hypothetical protein HY468_00120 [Candidatus Roizmanbacteria bacterium]|nr:hypothetical protein [Candidatus Roizmanbacteria bacterium]
MQQKHPAIAGPYTECLQFEGMAERGGLSTKDEHYGEYCSLYRDRRASGESLSDEKLFTAITGYVPAIHQRDYGPRTLLYQYENWYEEPKAREKSEVSTTGEQ